MPLRFEEYAFSMTLLRTAGEKVNLILNRPVLVMICCLIFALVNLLFRGSFMSLVKLHNDRQTLLHNLTEIDKQMNELQFKIQQAKDPVFVERQARDKLDMAAEDELVFVFASE